MADYVGRKLGGYELKKLLGKGAMGSVYLADQVALGREVAIKVLEKSELREPAAVQRFQGEARAVAALNHPNVMGVYDVGETDDCYYMAMELIDGESMGDAIKNGRTYTTEQIIDYGAQAARGLAAAHEAGLIHRDVKPDNILVTSNGVAKVADFGLAKEQGSDIHLTQTGAVYGSPAYMSPEQCQAEELTPASDIYSLGVTLYFSLTGAAPFDATSAVAVMMKHVTEQLTFTPEMSADHPDDLLRVIERCMAKAPADRWPGAAELADALERVGRGESIPHDQTLPTSQFAGPIIVESRPAWLVPALVGGVLVLVAAVLMAILGGGDDSRTVETPPGDDPVQTPEDDAPPAPAPEVSDPEPEPPAIDLGKQVIEAMGAERKGDLARTRELLEAAATAGDLAAYSADAAELLEKLRGRETALTAAREAAGAGNLARAQAAASRAHSMYPNEETLTLETDLGIVGTELATVTDLVERGKLGAAEAILDKGAAGAHAVLYEATRARLKRCRTTVATAERALEAGALGPAAEGLELAVSIWASEALRQRIEALARHRDALARGQTASNQRDFSGAAAAYEEALAAMDTPRTQQLLLEARFRAILAVAEAAATPAERLAAWERAYALRADEALAGRMEALREEMLPRDEDIVIAAMKTAEEQMGSEDHTAALATLEAVNERLEMVSVQVRGQHTSMVARARAGTEPDPARQRSIPEANRLFAEAERLRKTPLTLFSDKNEQSALSKYERIISTYPGSDKLGAAYFGAGHVAENLERIYKAVDYWEKAAQHGYRDPVACYLLAADSAEDELDDDGLARRLLQKALSICRDRRRAKIQDLIEDL